MITNSRFYVTHMTLQTNVILPFFLQRHWLCLAKNRFKALVKKIAKWRFVRSSYSSMFFAKHSQYVFYVVIANQNPYVCLLTISFKHNILGKFISALCVLLLLGIETKTLDQEGTLQALDLRGISDTETFIFQLRSFKLLFWCVSKCSFIKIRSS